ncbi:formimidoylglutamate deiminase [Ramlibacter solisilvae]|uniref:N-formylglutamate amidohydrolase n=1 Tax=Ramlibacter tataouinensis TaxID=94132 RepID=A0A127JR28_9BURK|nr:formimidoylglutamate deiminase [Ramlibacter tataouinensis]AMO22420.1 N-formylglutamate amidohydrolase [Ramlibacter tataouinensis]
MAETRRFFTPLAWLDGGWAQDVLLVAGADGRWQQLQPGCDAAGRAGAEVLSGPVLPGVVNGHSHAFQRAIAGLTERAAPGRDDFWSWRDRMYAAALRITPAQLEAIAAFLYAELLAAGYTQVCEFHYLHNDHDGRAYADPLEMSLALVRAARSVGIGLTLLPTLYMRSGFGARGLREDQRRFASTPDAVLRIAEAVRREAAGSPLLTAGIALHSLRAVDEGALHECARAARAASMPVHIHIAEQQLEVEDCLRQHGQRPIEWLLDNVELDDAWNLVHATQANAKELQALQRTGAAVVLCPTTEANLGDGVFDLPAWQAAGGPWSIGSDSHVTRSWTEELRLLEYSQRFVLRQRNVAARAAGAESTAAALLQSAMEGGSAAGGMPLAGLAVGQRADFSVVDTGAAALAGVPATHLLDALVFSSPANPMMRVVAAGRDARPRPDHRAYEAALRALW